MMQNVMYSIRQIQLEKVAKMRKKHQPALDDYAKLEEELLIVTELNINMIKSKLAKILTEESESKEKFLPDDIYLRVGALSPFGKDKGREVEDHYQEVLDKMEKYKELFYISEDSFDLFLFITFCKTHKRKRHCQSNSTPTK